MVLNKYKSLKVVIALLPTLTSSMPISTFISSADAAFPSSSLSTAQLYIYSVTSVCLVLLGGVFAGLTLGLMGQDEVYLKVIASSGTEKERKAANKLLELLDRGKHWLLVTLLLSNVITNETLPVILDRLLGGGFSAVFSSTVAIVIFGEIIPQSICVRYGLELGAFFAPYVLILMYLMYPVAYPIAKLLDYLLGEDHGTFYRKSGLKTLVNLHHTMGTERLNIDEVTIINSVLDLKVKPVSSIMTPIDKVYSLPSDKILDEKTVEEIFNAGYSRIPIHLPGEPLNFVGMLLVRILISYDPEDDLPISSFPLATLPETSLNTSCLNILNYFQEGKSHMVVVSETPGHDQGARGVLTLEDVIEELIGEEIVDETDVYIDVDKNIKRKNPGPFAKRNVTSYLHRLYSSSNLNKNSSRSNSLPHDTKYISKESYKAQSHLAVPPLKPSNLAADPLKTTNSHITIKKQPSFSFSKWDTSHIPQEDTTHKETSPLDLSNLDPDYGSNVGNDEDHQVHSSEASALVQGIYENAERHLVRCNDPDECADDISRSMKSAKLSFLNNSYGIPVPKTIPVSNGSIKDDFDPTFEDSNGIFEDNIVSLKGVNKTIIHDKHYIETHI